MLWPACPCVSLPHNASFPQAVSAVDLLATCVHTEWVDTATVANAYVALLSFKCHIKQFTVQSPRAVLFHRRES